MNEFVTKYKKYLIGAGAEVFLLLAAFFAGVYSHPTKEQTDTKIEYLTNTVHEVHTVYQDRLVEHTVFVKDTEQQKHVEKITTEVTNKDGTKTTITKEVTDTDNKQNISTEKDKTQIVNNTTTDKSKETESVKEEQHKLVINDKPGWRVAGSLGVDFSKIGPKQLLTTVPTSYPLVYGIEADRRIAGTVWGGVWLNTSKQAGLTLSLEF